MSHAYNKGRTLLATLIVAALSLPAAAAEPAWVTKSNASSKLLLNVLAKYSPESAGSLGVDGYDEQITDLSRDQFEPTNKDLRAAIAQLQKQLKAETDPKIRQDLEILIGAAEDQMLSSRLNRKYFMPFTDVTQMLFGVVREMLDPRIPKERQKTLLVRLEKYAGLSKGYRPLTVLANERLQERLKADKKLLGPYKTEVEQAINDAPTLIKGMKDLLAKSDLKGWESTFAVLETQLSAYNAQVKAEVLPRARLDHRLPPEVYANNLRQYGVDISPQELMAKSLTSFAEIRNQMNITAGLIARTQAARPGLPRRDARTEKAADERRPGDAAVCRASGPD